MMLDVQLEIFKLQQKEVPSKVSHLSSVGIDYTSFRRYNASSRSLRVSKLSLPARLAL